SSARRVIAPTASLIVFSAAGGTPPGSITTSGSAPTPCATPTAHSRPARIRRIEYLNFARDDFGGKCRRVLGLKSHIGSHLQSDLAVQACGLAIRVRRNGRIPRVGLCTDTQLQRQSPQPGLVIFCGHIATTVLAKDGLHMPALAAHMG